MDKMDLRSCSFDHEVYSSWEERDKCNHTAESGTVIDTEVIQIAPRTFEIYEIKRCSKGHFFRVFIKTHVISDEVIRSMYA